ncbi:MAG: arsenosugar biosynthesis radical SAM protein ArsS [Candidatus Bathyarchaeota archaeon]|nr:MAG: arsenosugar biosynthesis radical SAM protein ArsS [Candidatus Bathyarchaeota archaeon]
MNDFDDRIREIIGSDLYSRNIETIQPNIGLRCNNQCIHCHVKSSPERTEMMDWQIMQLILDVARRVQPKLVDITGGAPELNPLLRRFVAALKKDGQNVQVRTNLTVLLEPGMESIIEFYRDAEVKLVASLPCYLKKEVDFQRGVGVFEKSVRVLGELNRLGYGSDQRLILDLVYNPEDAFLPPKQASLEKEYREELSKNFGIAFNNLLTITNMPIGRFREMLKENGSFTEYQQLLKNSFNPETIETLMCRSQINIGWDGRMFDCDFNLAQGLSMSEGVPSHIRDFEPSLHCERRIVTGSHCFGCTAGHGSSCGGALIA